MNPRKIFPPMQCIECPCNSLCVYAAQRGGRDTDPPWINALWAVRFRTGWPKHAVLCGGGWIMKHKLEYDKSK